tara:strand:+ start:300 stop:506 length:207 start_codon:yes stop_codon:yes gene_type:complete
MEQQKKELIKLIIEKIDACDDIKKLQIIYDKLKEKIDSIEFCQKCGMSDDNPNSNHHCECSDSEDDYD